MSTHKCIVVVVVVVVDGEPLEIYVQEPSSVRENLLLIKLKF